MAMSMLAAAICFSQPHPEGMHHVRGESATIYGGSSSIGGNPDGEAIVRQRILW